MIHRYTYGIADIYPELPTQNSIVVRRRESGGEREAHREREIHTHPHTHTHTHTHIHTHTYIGRERKIYTVR
jgi:hypothetical protein